MSKRRLKKPIAWPDWWKWEVEISPHVEKRMIDRDFTEIDLRSMLLKANNYRPDVVDGRYLIETLHRRKKWRVIVEPDNEFKLLVVVTAYPI